MHKWERKIAGSQSGPQNMGREWSLLLLLLFPFLSSSENSLSLSLSLSLICVTVLPGIFAFSPPFLHGSWFWCDVMRGRKGEGGGGGAAVFFVFRCSFSFFLFFAILLFTITSPPPSPLIAKSCCSCGELRGRPGRDLFFFHVRANRLLNLFFLRVGQGANPWESKKRFPLPTELFYWRENEDAGASRPGITQRIEWIIMKERTIVERARERMDAKMLANESSIPMDHSGTLPA